MTDKSRFSFGKNWENYIQKHFSEQRVEIARHHLLSFLNSEHLEGKCFLDIGCGSGLHSLAALHSGAAKICSFDVDADAVATTKKLREISGDPTHWQVLQGSILDDQFLRAIEPADIVYSWGVLHHTGNMWLALDNAVKLMQKDALLYIALYDYHYHLDPPPEFWLDVKQRYNSSNPWEKRVMELWYIWKFILKYNPLFLPMLFYRMVYYKYSRGMDMYTDIKDWLGGWPMEFAKRADVEAWAEKNDLEKLTIKTGEANTEYLFRRITAKGF